MTSTDNRETGLPNESLCARCGLNIQEVKCSADIHGPNLCNFECPFCGFENSGPDDQCLREIRVVNKITMPASEGVSLPDEVNRLIGEIITNSALSENLLNRLLPEGDRGNRPYFSKDIETMKQMLWKVEPKYHEVVQRIVDLAEEISPVRHNLAHGQMILRALSEFSISAEEGETNRSDTTLPPEMVRLHAQREIGRTELSCEALEPYAAKYRELVRIISLVGSMQPRWQINDSP